MSAVNVDELTKLHRQAGNTVEPGHISLAKLPKGVKARVCALTESKEKDLQKLLVFGIIPGQTVEVIQAYPAIVVKAGRTTIALDSEVASKVLVKV